MKKILALVLACLMVLCAFAAVAEEAPDCGNAVLKDGERRARAAFAGTAHIDAAALRATVRADRRIARDRHSWHMAKRRREVLRGETRRLVGTDERHFCAVRRKTLFPCDWRGRHDDGLEFRYCVCRGSFSEKRHRRECDEREGRCGEVLHGV